jgi:hypothetical protein
LFKRNFTNFKQTKGLRLCLRLQSLVNISPDSIILSTTLVQGNNDLGSNLDFDKHWNYEVCPIIDVLSISSTSRCCTISNQHRASIVNLSSCDSHQRHRNVVRYRINIVSTLCTFLLVYIVHIVNIAMLYDIESTSCRQCEPFFLFTSSISSTLQCCTISSQHCVDIVNLFSCLHHSYSQHCAVQYRCR